MTRALEDSKDAVALARQIGVDFGAAMTVALAYIGDRLGIFKAMAEGRPMSSAEIAEHTRLDERYVREWASTMAAAGYLDYRAADSTFRMSAEQAMVLANEDNTFFTAGASNTRSRATGRFRSCWKRSGTAGASLRRTSAPTSSKRSSGSFGSVSRLGSRRNGFQRPLTSTSA